MEWKSTVDYVRELFLDDDILHLTQAFLVAYVQDASVTIEFTQTIKM